MNNQTALSDIQCVLLHMLAWFHKFCKDHELRYYVIGGTMLGAARHKGFIPWDDDVDVGMPRKDYERLAELMAAHVEGRYILETPESKAVDFVYPFSKLYDTTTTLIEDNRLKTKRGVYLDIFPLDGAGASWEESVVRAKAIVRKKKLLTLLTLSIREGRAWHKNLVVAIGYLVPDAFIKRLISCIESKASELPFDDCKFVGVLAGAWGLREVVKRQSFGEPVLYQFENLNVCGVAEPDLYLTSLYGDWRVLPPEDKRKSHHGHILVDLNKSYLTVDADNRGGLL